MQEKISQPLFLFSIDLEDVRMTVPDGERFAERVPVNVERYLEFLAEHSMCCTFFTVGDVAVRYPDLIKKILDRGHEIACHSNAHVALTKQTPAAFRADIEQNLEALKKAGAGNITGFRAPYASLTPESAWAYDILKEFGFVYSSSVIPARNPLYGWPGFGRQVKTMGSGILEIPMSLAKLPFFTLPFAGGVYFRVLPFWLVRFFFKKYRKQGAPIVSYFHPYEIDTEQERFDLPELKGSRVMNRLMYYNRGGVFKRLKKLMRQGFKIITYSEFVRVVAK